MKTGLKLLLVSIVIGSLPFGEWQCHPREHHHHEEHEEHHDHEKEEYAMGDMADDLIERSWRIPQRRDTMGDYLIEKNVNAEAPNSLMKPIEQSDTNEEWFDRITGPEPVTVKQLAYLNKLGYIGGESLTKDLASVIINNLVANQNYVESYEGWDEEGPPTHMSHYDNSGRGIE